MEPNPDPIEIEVKLGVDRPEVIRALLADPPRAGIAGFVPVGPPRPTVSVDRYLDTAAPAGLVKAAGLRARVREEGEALVLAVKSEGERLGDVHHRMELEGPAGPGRDPARWPASAARDRLLEASAGLPLLEIAALRQHRLKRRFRRGPTEVEVSLDEMEALVGERIVATRSELEAELVGRGDGAGAEGDVAALHGLAAAIRALPGVGDAHGSKLRWAQEAARQG